MKTLSSQLKISGLIVVLTIGLVYSLTSMSGMAQTPQENKAGAFPWKVIKVGSRDLKMNPPELDPERLSARVFEDQVPRHLPIKVEVENLDDENPLDNLSIKVTNLSKKPIYFLDLDLFLPDVITSIGLPLGFPLRYGRIELIQFDKPLRSDDVPIHPGESYVFKIEEKNLRGFRIGSAKKNFQQSEIRRVFLIFQLLNFGDGTGFMGGGGMPMPRKIDPSFDGSCGGGGGGGDGGKGWENLLTFSFKPSFFTNFGKPASLVSFPVVGSARATSSPQSGLCCPRGTSCVYARFATYACYCGSGRSYEVMACSSPLGACLDLEFHDRTCLDAQGNLLHCPEQFLVPCAALCDVDRDGFRSVYCGGDDCNDHDPDITPASPECIGHPDGGGPGGNGPGYPNCIPGGGPIILLDGVEQPDPCSSPIVLDISGNGFNLTNRANGVLFDLNSNGYLERLPWTAQNSDDAWLSLDRNGNGRIDNGAELFGNFTPQPPSGAPNGFIALAKYDRPDDGGNNDGLIDRQDAIFNSLRLWQDINHNGISEPSELHALASLSVVKLDLNYRLTRRTDEHGNRFRFRAKVRDLRGAQVGRWAWDVFFATGP